MLIDSDEFNECLKSFTISSCDFGAEIIGAMVAMTMRSAEHAARNLNKGEMEHLLLRTTEGNIFSMKV